jgi:pyruvyltransferase
MWFRNDSAKSFPKYKPNQVKEMLMVRGPLTYDKLISKGYKVKRVFGDPGLLFSDIYKSNVTKKHKIGIIPHFNDKNSIGVSKLIKLGCKYIDIEQADTPEKFLDELNECEVIFSSSLHGVIIGDSYEIPSYHIKFSNKIDDFKFRDYYASVKRPYSFVNAIKNIDLQTLEKNKSNYKCQYDKELIKQTIISVLS